MKTIWKALIGLLLTATVTLPVQAEEKTILMGTMAWEDLAPLALITKKTLEDQGFTVKLTEFPDWGIAYAALNKGDVQVLVSQVNHLTQDYWNRSKNKLERISPVSDGMFQGIAVPKYVPINNIEELNANAEKFGGKIIGIEPGAGLMRDTTNAIKDYDLKLQLVEGSTAAMTAALKSAIDRKEWIAVTLWDPSWMSLKFDVKYLADPKGIFPPSQTYYWIAQKGFSEKNPQARELMASVFVPLTEVRSINGAVSDGKTMNEAVDAWIAKNKDIMTRWENNKKY